MQFGLNRSIMQGLHIMPGKNECIIDRASDNSKDYLQSYQEMKRGCDCLKDLPSILHFFCLILKRIYAIKRI